MRRVRTYPVAAAQGLRIRRTILRLPEAQGRTGRAGSGEPGLRLLALGDSLTAGVGVDHHEHSLVGRLAALLADAHHTSVHWSVQARGGATAGEVLAQADADELASADIIVLSVGVNDAKNLHSTGRYRRELASALDLLLARAPTARIVFFELPMLERFPALPPPLGELIGLRARVIDTVGRGVCARRPAITFVDLPVVEAYELDLFSVDGFHPSAKLHRIYAESAAQALLPTE